MARIREVVYYGGEHGPDRELVAHLSEKMGLPVRTVPTCGFYGMTGRMPPWLRKISIFNRLVGLLSPWRDALHILRKATPDQLVLIKLYQSGIAFLVLDALRWWWHPKVVITWFTKPGPPRPPARWLFRRVLPRAAAVFTYTPMEVELYARVYGIPEGVFTVVDLQAVDLDEVAAAGDEPGFDVVMGGVSGRDWETYLEVCRAMPDLRFAAMAPLGSIDTLGDAPNLTKFGSIPSEQYHRTLATAKINMLLLRFQFGAVGQRDLLAMGKLGFAVIATDHPAITHYADEGDVLFVPEGDVGAAVAAVRKLIDRPDLRAEMGRSLRAHIVGRCSPERVAEQWAAILGGLIEREPAGVERAGGAEPS